MDDNKRMTHLNLVAERGSRGDVGASSLMVPTGVSSLSWPRPMVTSTGQRTRVSCQEMLSRC